MKKSFLQKTGVLFILMILTFGYAGCAVLSYGGSPRSESPTRTSIPAGDPIGQSNGESVILSPLVSEAAPTDIQDISPTPTNKSTGIMPVTTPEYSPVLTPTAAPTAAATSVITSSPSPSAAVSTSSSAPAPTPKPTTTTSATAVPTAVPTAAPTPIPTACPTPAPTPAPTTVSDDYQVENGKANYMFQLVNEARAAEGLPAYTWDSSLVPPAMKHCRDMAENNFFSHVSPTWGDFSTRFTASGISTSAAAENLAYVTIYDGATSYAHSLLMDSEGHRANILSSTYTRIGIAVIYDTIDERCYFVQWFAK